MYIRSRDALLSSNEKINLCESSTVFGKDESACACVNLLWKAPSVAL